MGNADDAIKARARKVIGTNLEPGIAQVIRTRTCCNARLVAGLVVGARAVRAGRTALSYRFVFAADRHALDLRVQPLPGADRQFIACPRRDPRPQHVFPDRQLHFHLPVTTSQTLRDFGAQDISNTGLQRRLQHQRDVGGVDANAQLGAQFSG